MVNSISSNAANHFTIQGQLVRSHSGAQIFRARAGYQFVNKSMGQSFVSRLVDKIFHLFGRNVFLDTSVGVVTISAETARGFVRLYGTSHKDEKIGKALARTLHELEILKDAAITRISKNPAEFSRLSIDLQRDPEVLAQKKVSEEEISSRRPLISASEKAKAMLAIHTDPTSFEQLPEALKNDGDLIALRDQVVAHNEELARIPLFSSVEKAKAMLAIHTDPSAFEQLPEALKNDRDLIALRNQVVARNEELAHNEELARIPLFSSVEKAKAMLAIHTDPSAFEQLPEALKNDRDLIALRNQVVAHNEELARNRRAADEVINAQIVNGAGDAFERISKQSSPSLSQLEPGLQKKLARYAINLLKAPLERKKTKTVASSKKVLQAYREQVLDKASPELRTSEQEFLRQIILGNQQGEWKKGVSDRVFVQTLQTELENIVLPSNH